MGGYPWRPLGELLVERGLLDPYELEVVLKEQKLSGQLLGELLVRKRLVTPAELAAALAAHHGVYLDHTAEPDLPEEPSPPLGGSWRPLGRVLVDRGTLTESGLQRALVAQRRTGVPLGELLVGRRWIAPAELVAALGEQQGVPLHPAVLDTATELSPEERAPERYELRPGPGKAPIYVASSYLEATDFAFELLHSSDPTELEIVRIAEGEEEERVWHYTREESEAFRAEAASQRRRFSPLELVGTDGPDGDPPPA